MPGILKYQQDDVRNILERASARETAARVAVGAVCRRIAIKRTRHPRFTAIHYRLAVIQVQGPNAGEDWRVVEESVVRCHEPDVETKMIAAIDAAKESGDTVGEEYSR